MLLQTIYEVKVLEIIKNFISEVSAYYGANERERFELVLASEEASTHIIENYPSDKEDIFEISCLLYDCSIHITFSNQGLPVDSKNIPHYDMSNPDKSIDGLKFFLIEKFVDNFEFKNMGNMGWQSILHKKILNPKILKRKSLQDNFVTKEKISIYPATSDDAYDITKLAYYTYSYSYAKSIFYYPELLAKAIADESIMSHVAKNTNNEIIGHIGLIRSKYSFDIAESAMMMVSPRYRKSMAVLRLLKTQYKVLKEKKHGFKFYYANLVTSHDVSQRLVVHFDLKPFALKLSVHEHSEILEMKTIKTQRESHLYSIAFIDENKVNLKLFIPSKHNEIVKKIFSESPVSLELSKSVCDYKSSSALFVTDKLKKESVGEIKIKTFGNGLYKELKQIVKQLYLDSCKTIYLYIPVDKPLPDMLEDELRKLGFFFCGITMESINKWYMLYTSLSYQVFDFKKVMLYVDTAKELGKYVQKEYESLD